MKRFLIVLLSLLLIPVSVSAVNLTPEQEKVANSILDNVLSPFCPGRLLHDCPSSAAAELKTKIEEKVAAGESETQIYDYLYGLYGNEIRATPAAEGFGLVAWFAPVLFLVIGIGIWVVWMRSKSEAPALEGVKLDQKTEERIARELSAFSQDH